MLFDTGHQHARLALVETPPRVYTRALTYTPTLMAWHSTVQRDAGTRLTPKTLDLFLAFLFSPAYPVSVLNMGTQAPGRPGWDLSQSLHGNRRPKNAVSSLAETQTELSGFSNLTAPPDLAHRPWHWPIDTGPKRQPPEVPG